MTRLMHRTLRRYHVGSASVLRRCVVAVVAFFALSATAAMAQGYAFNAFEDRCISRFEAGQNVERSGLELLLERPVPGRDGWQVQAYDLSSMNGALLIAAEIGGADESCTVTLTKWARFNDRLAFGQFAKEWAQTAVADRGYAAQTPSGQGSSYVLTQDDGVQIMVHFKGPFSRKLDSVKVDRMDPTKQRSGEN